MRVIANVAINERAGTEIASRADLLEILLKILGKKTSQIKIFLFTGCPGCFETNFKTS